MPGADSPTGGGSPTPPTRPGSTGPARPLVGSTGPAAALPPDQPDLLVEILSEARSAGFLGPGPPETHLRHAEGFLGVLRRLEGPPEPSIVDLGSGGGVPGLVLAERWPEASLVLLDSNARRTGFLERAVERLGLGGRVEVLHGRAEECGRDPRWRGAFDGLVARSFGRPAVLAECGAPFLRSGGWLVASEPPAESSGGPGGSREDSAERWPPAGLGEFGLVPESGEVGEFSYQVLRQTRACPERFPRRNGVPAKKPLF